MEPTGRQDPSVPPRCFHCQRRHISNVCPHPWNVQGVNCLGIGFPSTPHTRCCQPECSSGSCLVQAEPERKHPHQHPSGEGVMGSRSHPGLGRGLPKPASLTSAGLLPPSQSLSTLMCTIKWLCLHSQKLTGLGSLQEGSATLPGQQISKVFYLISS